MPTSDECHSAQLLSDLAYVLEAVNLGASFGIYNDLDDDMIHAELRMDVRSVDCAGHTIFDAVHAAVVEWQTGV